MPLEQELYELLKGVCTTYTFEVDETNDVFPYILYIPLNTKAHMAYDDTEQGLDTYHMIHLFTNGYDTNTRDALKDALYTLNDKYDVSINDVSSQLEDKKQTSSGMVSIFRFKFDVKISKI
jgi:hypothetical protein